MRPRHRLVATLLAATVLAGPAALAAPATAATRTAAARTTTARTTVTDRAHHFRVTLPAGYRRFTATEGAVLAAGNRAGTREIAVFVTVLPGATGRTIQGTAPGLRAQLQAEGFTKVAIARTTLAGEPALRVVADHPADHTHAAMLLTGHRGRMFMIVFAGTSLSSAEIRSVTASFRFL